jgi:hypothetical protein
MTGGGTFCRFTVGKRGTSAAHLRYISRVSAVERETGQCDFISQNMPTYVLQADNLERLRDRIAGYAKMQESQEAGRTHYRAIVSFEQEIPPERAAQMVKEWLKEAFPTAQAMAFFHHNTEHLHAHIWIDARGSDGKKLHFSARDYRSLDEKWNRIYSREIGRDEQEHLDKKFDKQRTFYKQHYGDNEKIYEGNEKNHGDKERTTGESRMATGGGKTFETREHSLEKDEPGTVEFLRTTLTGNDAQGKAVSEFSRAIQESHQSICHSHHSVQESQRLHQGLESLHREALSTPPRGQEPSPHRQESWEEERG